MNARIPAQQTVIVASAVITEPHGSRIATQEFVINHGSEVPVPEMLGKVVTMIGQQGGLVEKVHNERIVLYPITSLDAITFDVNRVVGVSAIGAA